MKKITTVSIDVTTLSALKEFKTTYNFHSLDDAINQLLILAKTTLVKK